MAAGTWLIFNTAKKKIGNGTINLSSTPLRLALFNSASNLKTSASALPRGIYNSLTEEVASGNGYALLGKAISGETWGSGASAMQYKFDATDVVFTASGGTIPNIKYAVIFASNATSASRHLLCFVTLTASQFTLGTGNTLTIQHAATGIFTLV